MTFLLFVLSRPLFQRPWPVDGGEANPPAAVPPSLILTGSPSLNIPKETLQLFLFYIFSTNWPGHEDGKVKVWLSRQNSLRLLTALDTARCFFLSSTSQRIGITPYASRYFVAEDTDDRSDTMDEWPPFRRVGSFDPFSDDPR